MSCQLGLLANLQDVNAVKRFLYPQFQEAQKTQTETFEGWDDSDWGWKDDAEEESVRKDQNHHAILSWLQQCKVYLSPAAELMAIAHEDKLVLLCQKWDSEDENIQMKYNVVFQGCIKQEEGEKITCVLCLPLASQKRSTQGGPDWTCVIVGFSSGYVRMYTETGTLLLSQIFSEDAVNEIKCRTYEPPRHAADAEKHEEMTIQYARFLVSIDGFSLVQSLRACRNQVARAAASGTELIQPPPLAYKKYGLSESEQTVDHIACGMGTQNPFDQMVAASMVGGYTATVRPTPPASHLYMTAGTAPYVGYYYAIEGGSQPMFSDVAHAVASKLKSALYSQISSASSWLGFGSKTNPEPSKEKRKPKIEPATSLPSRFGLHDKRRVGESIVLSPDNRLAAITDSYGRVMMVDILQGVAIRMWKGYRDAQCGWVDVKEDSHHERNAHSAPCPRRALFFVIYAPRRGILEVWTAQHGPRVAAFNVSKWCHLLCPGHGLMGLNNVTFREVKLPIYHVYLIDPTGIIKTVDVPFHLALSDKNSKRARDMHLLKKLKLTLKEQKNEISTLQSSLVETLLDMRIASIRQQGIERILQTKYLGPTFLENVLNSVLAQLQGERENLDYERRSLLQYCIAQLHLLHTFKTLSEINASTDQAMEADNGPEALCRVLSMSPAEVKEFVEDLEQYFNLIDAKPRVHFHSENTMSVIDFLNCFECEMVRSSTETSELEAVNVGTVGNIKNKLQLHIVPSITEGRKFKLAQFLFLTTLERGTSSDYNQLLKNSLISPEDLQNLFLLLWLAEERKKLHLIGPLHTLIKSITSLKDVSEVSVDSNQPSPWWVTLRNTCSQTEHIGAALLTAMVGRSIAMELAKYAMNEVMTLSSGSGQLDFSEWESVTVDRAQWTLLVRQLQDLLAVKCLLSMTPAAQGLVEKPVWEAEPIHVSVKRVLDGGRGVLPEFVATWIAGQGILPSMLCLSQDETQEKHEEEDMETEQTGKALRARRQQSSASVQEMNPIVSQLQVVQQRLPLSLDTDILMANCAWEYMVIWNKDPEITFPLQQALEYLKCIQNAVLQHGLGSMMWQMFAVKKLSSAAFLMEKVGKAPKDRLCRRDVGLSEVSLEKLMGLAVDLLQTIKQAHEDVKEPPLFNVEDLWQSVAGPTSLVELAAEQKETNAELVDHVLSLCVILHGTLHFNMKSVKPLSMFDTKGRNAFFKPLQSKPVLPCRVVDESIMATRKHFLCRIVSQAVQSLGDRLPSSSRSGSPVGTPPSSPGGMLSLHRTQSYTRWPPLLLEITKDLCIDMDIIRRTHVCELYSSGRDKMAEEVLLTVSDHVVMGSQLLQVAGQRIAHYIWGGDTPASVENFSKCSPALSTWLRSLDMTTLRCPVVPASNIAVLLGHAVNQLPEGHSEYAHAIELVELVNSLS